jgi:hypothetical protein
MGMPNITITFQSLANSAVQRLSRGIVGVIVRDTEDNGACTLTRATQVKTALPGLGAGNQAYIERAFLGYINSPSRVEAYVLPDSAASLSEALAYFATKAIGYLAAPPGASAADAAEVKAWIGDQRDSGATPKAVLPLAPADDTAIVNFTTDEIHCGGEIYTAAEYCSRIAGLIAGTPPSMSCTYAPLPEVTAVAPLSKSAMDAAIDNGELILFSDGAKIKVGRGVNSFKNLASDPNKNGSFKKIKVVEIMDMIESDIKATAQNTYIGRYANSYDNKCLLVAAISDYFRALEREGLLAPGKNSVEIDTEAQEAYLLAHGADLSGMSGQEIKEANTGDEVFLSARVSILDAIEDITLKITA